MTVPLLYFIRPDQCTPASLKKILAQRPEIKFVSTVGVDLGGNDTDAKIPMAVFLKDIEKFLWGEIHTDGSSVVLPGIATLNDGKVDFEADTSVNWYIDYNYEHLDQQTRLPVGTLRIPSYLIHSGQKIGSRSVLRRAAERVNQELMELFTRYPNSLYEQGIAPENIQEILLTAATELEFWVKTPNEKADIEQLTVSQVLREQYWKRTKGVVRTALEHSLLLLEAYGLQPEMGHKEVGGVTAQIGQDGGLTHVMEQLEITWRYSDALQTADNQLLARILIKEAFRRHGLEVTFMAKPMEKVAGSGGHTHVGLAAKLKDGSVKNLFTPAASRKDFLSPVGWGALMGILKNYEAIGAFITASNDAFNRLQPGFEAPVCIVASVGHDVSIPSRNRTVLVGLIRENNNPTATRLEVRSPNPHSNNYLTLAALYQGMLDGISYALTNGRTSGELEKEFSKKPGEPAVYLQTERAYRSEEDVFEAYSREERDRLFGVPPATVWETLANLERYPEKTAVLTKGEVFTPQIIHSYSLAMLNQWMTELCDRILPENAEVIRSLTPDEQVIHTALDQERWQRIHDLRFRLLKDRSDYTSLFTQLRQAIAARDYQLASRLQLEIEAEMKRVKQLYAEYKKNLF
ncbi:MAG TPA: glutamine synthetase [Firmicutes bacterium]|jgi:glutamine synthetase|nr:glutamine synthetase [Bacillota bacterium]